LLATGATLGIAMQMRERGLHQGDVHSLPLWGMRAKASQPAQAGAYDVVTTLEDHLVDGGFGSWLMESLSRANCHTRVEARALSAQVCGTVGSQATLNALGGLGLAP
jgi:transketolase